MEFVIKVKTEGVDRAPRSSSELYDFFYAVSDGQIEADIEVASENE